MIDRVPVEQRPAFVAEAVATARASGNPDALVDLVAHLPADQHRAVFVEAWRRPQDPDGAAVLAALDPHLAAARGLPATPFVAVGLRRPVDAACERVADLAKRAQRQWRDSRPAPEVVATVRRLFETADKRRCLVTVPAVGAAIRVLGGVEAVREYVDAVRDCYRWWP
jgi:hypothetical protein